MFKRIIPFASAALLLFSCGGGGSKDTAISMDQLIKPKHGSYVVLGSEKLETKKGQTLKFSCSFENFEEGHEYINISVFLLANEDTSERLEAIDAIDEVKSITYNDKELKCENSNPDDKEAVTKWLGNIMSDTPAPELEDTYVLYNMPTDPVAKAVLINHYNSKNTDKFNITITANQETTCIGTFANSLMF